MKEIAERVWREQPDCCSFQAGFHAGFHAWKEDDGPVVFKQDVDPYSSSLVSAWLVVEKLRKAGWAIKLHITPTGLVHCEFSKPGIIKATSANSDQVAFCICNAALMTV